MEQVKEEIISGNFISAREVSFEIKHEPSTSKEQVTVNEDNSYSLCVKSEIPDIKYGIGNDDIYIKLEPVLTEELHIKIEDDGGAACEAFNGFPRSLHLKCAVCDDPDFYRNHLRLISCVEKQVESVISEDLHIRNVGDRRTCNVKSVCDFKSTAKSNYFLTVLQEESDDDIPLELLKHKLCTIQSERVSNENNLKPPCLKKLEPEVGIIRSVELTPEVVDGGGGESVQNIYINQGLIHEEMDIKSEDEETQETPVEDTYNCENKMPKLIKNSRRVKPFKCNICDSSFKRKFQFKVHFRTHTGEKPFKCNICDNSYRENGALKVHLRTHTGEKPFICNFCDYRSIYNQHLQQHLRMHTGEKPYSCKFCDYSFGNKQHLQVHLRIHTGEKPFICNICNYSFRRKDKLKLHLQNHTGQKPFKCNICNYSSVHKDKLNRHLRIHNGEKAFKCNICNYSCIEKDRLKCHLRIHTGQKPFICNICNYRFGQKEKLKIHLRTHTGEKPFKCNFCDYCSGIKNSLKTHLRTHTGDKPHKCNLCDRSFISHSGLNYHLRTHSRAKLFKCNDCDYTSRQEKRFQKHFLAHTGQNSFK